MSSTSRFELAYLLESSFGTIPTGTPRKIRNTGESLKYDIKSDSSKEINSTRQVRDSVHIDADATGGFNFELSWREYDELLAALLASTFNTFGTDGVNSLTVTIDATAGTITDDGVDGFAGLVAGQWFSLSSTANSGVYLIGSMTDDVITVDASTPLLADEASVAADISSTRISNGVLALPSFSIEKQFADVSQYLMHRGRCVSKMELDFTAGSRVTGMFDFLGKDAVRADATQFDEAASASYSYESVNTVTDTGLTAGAGTFLVRNSGGTNLIASAYALSMKISVDAKLRARKAVGILGNSEIVPGTFEIGGTLEIYLESGDIYDAALANTTLSVQFPVKDSSNNGYAYIFNNVKLGVPEPTSGSMDSDVVLTVPFTAIAPTVATDRMITIDRFGAALA